MCGICAFIGEGDAIDHLLFGLKMLLNRGYDSAGLCTIKDSQLFLKKFANKQGEYAVDMLEEHRAFFQGSSIGMVHNRWATTGPKTDQNAHPHLSSDRKIVVVHNGIIENYLSLKKELIDKGYSFSSETDTEVVANLISLYYEMSGDTNEAIHLATRRLEGTWGLVILCLDEPDRMYCTRHGSPLLIGFSEKYVMVASEQSGFCQYVNNYICLNDHDIVTLEKSSSGVKFNKKGDYELRQITVEIDSFSPTPYSHWTEKEIYEQTDSTMRAMGMGGRILNNKMVKLGGLTAHRDELVNIDNLILLGCGTSFFAGMHCLSLFKELCDFNTVQLFDGAEFNKYDIPRIGKTGLIFLSQSGETKDLHRALEIGRDSNLYMIGVVNVVDSLIAREVNCGVYLNAGKEVGVASTKAFSSQIIVLHLIATWFAQNRQINEYKRQKLIESIRRTPLDIGSTLAIVNDRCDQVANYLVDKNSLFILGKGLCEAVAKEGALKIKEIAYLPAEGYSSSALKHGPYALIEPGTPIIMVMPDDINFRRNCSIIDELKSRDAFVITISDRHIETRHDISIKISKNSVFRGLLSILPMQLIAYKLALKKGLNPDRPRNLCKAVNVD